MRKRISNETFNLIIIPFAVLVTVSTVFLNYLALSWSDAISRELGHDTYRIESSDGSDVDAVYYKSDFVNEEKLNAYCGSLAYFIAAEGIVLLKNDVLGGGGLPLRSKGGRFKLSCFSVSSVDPIYGGGGSGSVNSSSAVDLKSALEKEGFLVNPVLWNFYKKKNSEGYKRVLPGWGNSVFRLNEVPWVKVENAVGDSFSEYGDAALVVISRSGGEGSDLPSENFAETANTAGNRGNYLELAYEEKEMLDALDARFDNIIVLLNTNNPFELDGIDGYANINSVLWLGSMGQFGADAIAAVLSGKINPSGRLTDTYVYDSGGSPAAVNGGANFWIKNYPSQEKYAEQADQYLVEAEGLYIGYRYYETRYEDKVLGRSGVGNYEYSSEVAYPFGYGLSYTRFSYSDFGVKKKGGEYAVSVTVTNEGEVAGKDVIQIYLQKPYTEYDVKNRIEKPSVELVGFAKTEMLKPGSSQKISISVKKEQLASYDYVGAKGYVVGKGNYYFALGGDAHSAINNILAVKGKTIADGMTAEGDPKLVRSFYENSFDIVSFKIDSKTGNEVTNAFGNADIKNYADGKGFEYLTRSNWSGTYPTAFADGKDGATGEYFKTFSGQFIASLAPPYTEEGAHTVNETVNETKLTLASLIGVKEESAAWEDFINGIPLEDLLVSVRTGGFGLKENTKFGIPATKYRDGPAGLSIGDSVTFYPSEIVVASTWNSVLAFKLGDAVGNEALFKGISGWYAPALNLHRTPFGGRNFEYYSEDPYVAGVFGAETVKGAQSKGLTCFVKHFALNDTEGVQYVSDGRKGSNNGMATFNNEQAIREIYLKPFEFAVKAGKIKGIMNAFNRIGNLWCGHNSDLQRRVLRREWGFKGCIVTDNAGLPSYMEIKAGLRAGTNLWMNWNGNAYRIEKSELTASLAENIRESAKYALYSVANSSAMNGLLPNSKIVPIMPVWQWWLIVFDVLIVAADVVCTIAIVNRSRR